MNFSDLVFYAASLFIVICVCIALFSGSASSKFKYHIFSLVSIAIVFFLLGSDLSGPLQILIISAVTSAGLFAVIRNRQDEKITTPYTGSLPGVIAAGIFSALILGLVLSVKWREIVQPDTMPGAFEFARILQTEYALILFLLALMLFSIIAGAAYILKGK